MKNPHQTSLVPQQIPFVTSGLPGRRFLAGCAFVLLFSGGLYAKSPKWEYLVVNAAVNNRSLETLLNTNGAEGWELVQINERGIAIFKRLKTK